MRVKKARPMIAQTPLKDKNKSYPTEVMGGNGRNTVQGMLTRVLQMALNASVP